jgi:DNA-directed RNA polymerase subunit RPC12/RpoP
MQTQEENKPKPKTILYENALRYACMYECGSCGHNFGYVSTETKRANPKFCPECSKPIENVQTMLGVY